MTTIAHTLRAIEARAERAIVLELQTMMQEILALRTSLVLQDRSHADTLLLTLDRLTNAETATPAGNAANAPTPSRTRREEVFSSRPMIYRASFFDHEYGSLEDVVTLDAFDAAVQLVVDRLDPSINCAVEASWTNCQGSMKVQSLDGIVLASVEAARGTGVKVRPAVTMACRALQAGDSGCMKQQFGLALMHG